MAKPMLDSNIKKLKSKNVNLCLVISLLFIATFNSPTKILAQSAKNIDKSPV
jgi:hypothetical protein